MEVLTIHQLVAATAVAVVAVMMFMIAVVVAAVATIVVAATAFAVVAMTAATAGKMLHKVVDLCLCGVAILEDGALEVERLTSQRVVEVNLHFLFANFYDAAIEACTLLVLQGHDGIGIDVLVVEMAIDAEHLAVEVKHEFVVILAIALFLAQRDIEVLTLGGGNHLVFKLVEGKTKARNETEGALSGGLFDEFFAVLAVHIQLVGNGYILVFLVVHIP